MDAVGPLLARVEIGWHGRIHGLQLLFDGVLAVGEELLVELGVELSAEEEGLHLVDGPVTEWVLVGVVDLERSSFLEVVGSLLGDEQRRRRSQGDQRDEKFHNKYYKLRAAARSLIHSSFINKNGLEGLGDFPHESRAVLPPLPLLGRAISAAHLAGLGRLEHRPLLADGRLWWLRTLLLPARRIAQAPSSLRLVREAPSLTSRLRVPRVQGFPVHRLPALCRPRGTASPLAQRLDLLERAQILRKGHFSVIFQI